MSEVASGIITSAGDVFALNAALAGLPYSGHYRAVLIAPADWPSWVAGAIGWRSSASNVLTNSWYRGNTTIGPIGVAGLISLVDGAPANNIADAIMSGTPITWVIYEESADTAPMTAPWTGNLATDLATSTFKGGVDTAAAAGGAAGDAARKLAQDALEPLSGGLGLVLAGVAILFILGRR